MRVKQHHHDSATSLDLVDELRRLLALAGMDEHAAIAAFDRLVALRGREPVLAALLALVPGLASGLPEDVETRTLRKARY